MTPTRPPPQTLAEVQVGDEVVIKSGSHCSPDYRAATVTRTTDTQIIVGSRRFSRKYGSVIGDRYGASIVLGGDAAELIAEVDRRRNETAFLVATKLPAFTQAGVRALRTACDRAEAALRAAGEWADE